MYCVLASDLGEFGSAWVDFFGLVWSRVVYLQNRFEHDGSPLEQRCTSSSYLFAATSSEIVIQQNAIICIAPVEGGSPSSSTFCKWASYPIPPN